MKNSSIYYSVGPLLYCPANRETIAPSVIQQQFGTRFSLSLCLEDTISDQHVEAAEHTLAASLHKIRHAAEYASFYLPKIFIRLLPDRAIIR